MAATILKKTGKIFLWITGILVLLLVLIFIFLQTDTFNKLALEYTLKELNTSQTPKNNKIDAESIEGNILTGIKLNKGSITVQEDTLLSFNYLEAKYDLWGLIEKKILVESVILNDPVISSEKIKSGDSLIWNFETLLSPAVKDTVKSVFDWDVSIENLKIQNGFLRVSADSTKLSPRWQERRTLMGMFDLYNTDISNLNIDLNAKYYKDFKSISINNLSFNTNSPVNLRSLHFNANLNEKDTTTDVWNFELLTDRSDIKIYRLYAEKFNPFYDFVYEDLGNKNIKASIDIKKFNFKDLKFFLSNIDYLDSVVSVKLDAEGKYGDLFAENLKVRLPNSELNFKGKVVNLQNPDSLYLDIEGNNIVIDPKDIKTVYNDGIPDLTHLGIVTADLKYRGYLNNFSSEFNIGSQAGYAEGNVTMDLDNEVYSGYVSTRSLNIGPIIKDRSLNGSINLTAKFDGRGFSMNKLNTNLIYSVTNSRLGRYDVRYSGGTIHAAGGNIKLDIKHSSSFGNAVVNGRLNITNASNPVYNLKGSVQRFNAAGITGSYENSSNLNFTFNINGRGISPENINGSYKLNIADSRYGDYVIPSTPVDAEIRTSGPDGKISIVTDMADIKADGSLNFSEMLDAVMKNAESIGNMIAASFDSSGTYMDSVHTSAGYPFFIDQVTSPELIFNYNIITKDSSKLNTALKPFGIGFNGSVSGSITSGSNNFSSNTEMDIKHFSYNDSAVVLKNVTGNVSIRNPYTESLTALQMKINAIGNNISFNGNRFDSVDANVSFNGNNAQVRLLAGMDTTAKALLNGNIIFEPGKISADLDSVNADYAGYKIKNRDNWIFSFNNADRVQFTQFNIQSRNAVLNLSGDFSLNNESSLKLEGNNIKITDIADIVNKADSSYILSSTSDIKGEFSKVLLTYNGTMENPDISAKINTNTLTYSDKDMGTITADLKYSKDLADARIKLQNEEKKGDLVITGLIPYKNPLSSDTSSLEISSKPVEINLKANNFLLDYFATLITQLQSLRGTLNADLTAKGTAADPSLTGNLKITNGGYLLPLTGMDYSFDASMSTDNFKLVLDRLKLYNEDDESRHIDLYGTLDFKDLKITDINLEASGDMVLLDKDVEQNDLGVTGYILAGIGTPPVKVTGSIDSLFVSGQLLIKDATISSIPMQGSGYNTDEDNFIYVDEGNDTLRFVRDSSIVITKEELQKINPFYRNKYKVLDDSAKDMFVDLDVNVKTENNIYASIDFNNITRDRLFGELKADLDIRTENGALMAYGTVDVAGDSYYRFYRDFKLNESSIKFDGDITNPGLNVKGVYTSQKNNEQYGSVTTSDVEVYVDITGTVKDPHLSIGLNQDGSEVTGADAQSDAISYLLFGRYKSELTASERTAVASSLGSSVGSMYASSYISQAVREILPFIVDAQFNYTEGNVTDTDVELISELGDARVKFGGKLLKDVKNFELVVDYPVNNLLNLDLPETLLLEFAREERKQNLTTDQNDVLTTEIKLLYKIKF